MDGRLIQWVTHLYYIYLFYQINAQGRRAKNTPFSRFITLYE